MVDVPGSQRHEEGIYGSPHPSAGDFPKSVAWCYILLHFARYCKVGGGWFRSGEEATSDCLPEEFFSFLVTFRDIL